MKAQLFTTVGCHLCEQAHGQLVQLQQEGMAVDIEPVEIADDEQLMDRYGIRIPVIRVDAAEIDWPFAIGELRRFLNSR